MALGSPFTCQPLFLAGLAQQCVLCHSAELKRSTDPAPVLRELDRSRDIQELYRNMLEVYVYPKSSMFDGQVLLLLLHYSQT